MKRTFAVFAVIALAISLTWAAEQVAGWLGFEQQDRPPAEDAQAVSGTGQEPEAAPGATQDASPEASHDTAPGALPDNPEPEISADASSIEDDLARIEEALNSEEVLEEFTPSQPLSADLPIELPTDI